MKLFVIIQNNLRNSGAKYIGNKMLRQFQNFSVCLANILEKKLLKTQQKPLYITLVMALTYLCVLFQGLLFVFLTVETTC